MIQGDTCADAQSFCLALYQIGSMNEGCVALGARASVIAELGAQIRRARGWRSKGIRCYCDMLVVVRGASGICISVSKVARLGGGGVAVELGEAGTSESELTPHVVFGTHKLIHKRSLSPTLACRSFQVTVIAH